MKDQDPHKDQDQVHFLKFRRTFHYQWPNFFVIAVVLFDDWWNFFYQSLSSRIFIDPFKFFHELGVIFIFERVYFFIKDQYQDFALIFNLSDLTFYFWSLPKSQEKLNLAIKPKATSNSHSHFSKSSRPTTLKKA